MFNIRVIVFLPFETGDHLRLHRNYCQKIAHSCASTVLWRLWRSGEPDGFETSAYAWLMREQFPRWRNRMQEKVCKRCWFHLTSWHRVTDSI